jgi:hypothetical protein
MQMAMLNAMLLAIFVAVAVIVFLGIAYFGWLFAGGDGEYGD